MTNEELSNKILNDIQYIKDKAEVFQKRLVDFKLDDNQLKEIRSVLNYFRTADFTFVSTLNNQEGLLNLENQFSPYKIYYIKKEIIIFTCFKSTLVSFVKLNYSYFISALRI